MDLLAGADTAPRAAAVESILGGLRPLRVDGVEDFREAARIFVDVRRGGRTVRSLTDCLIAAVAIRHDVPVLHRDADFDAIAASTRLRLLR